MTLITLACLSVGDTWGRGRIPPPLLLRTMNGLTKKIVTKHLSMGNVEQICISAYPSRKITLSTLEVPLNISGFYQNHNFVEVAFLRNLLFLAKKRLNQKTKVTQFFIL